MFVIDGYLLEAITESLNNIFLYPHYVVRRLDLEIGFYGGSLICLVVKSNFLSLCPNLETFFKIHISLKFQNGRKVARGFLLW